MRGAVLLLGLSFLFPGGAWGGEKETARLDLTIRVWILDGASVDAASLLNAKRTAEKIYEKAGVQRDKRHSVAGVMSFPINRDYLGRASKGMQAARARSVKGPGSTGAAGKSPAATPDSNSCVAVWVQNNADVPELTLEEAKEVTASVFQHDGLAVEWFDPAASGGRRIGPADLVLRAVESSMIADWGLDTGHLAFALVPRTTRSGYIAGVITDRVDRVAARLGYPLGVVLGHVMAHELGHLLLGTKRHSVAGIMSFPVDHDYMLQASKGMLRFRPSQVRRIRAEIAKRTNAADSRDGACAKKKRITALDHTIRVWIFERASVDAASLMNAKRAVEKIYEKTGVQITWIHRGGESAGPAPQTSESRRLGPLDLMLRIRPAHPSDSPAHRSEFGRAYLGGGHARIADVYYGRVKSATFDKLYGGLDRLATPLPANTRPGVALGVVMAHELGHLLLGSHNHSAGGVMKPQWSRDDLMKAYFGGLGFNREQIKRIRSSVGAREQSERERTTERVSAEVR